VAGLTAMWRVLSDALPSSITRLKKVPMVKSRSALLQGRWCSRYLGPADAVTCGDQQL
jgi:hypothetical protein